MLYDPYYTGIILIHYSVFLQASLLVLSPASTISSGASPIHSEEAPLRGVDFASQTGDSLRGPKSIAAQTDPTTRSHIQVLKKVDGNEDVIEFVTMPNIPTTTLYHEMELPVTSRSGKDDDLMVEVKYRDKNPPLGTSDDLQSEINILHTEPQSFETVLVDPGETTTEVLVDAEGNKRIIVRQVRRTLVTQQQCVSTQRHHVQTRSTRDGHIIPDSEQAAFSQIVLQSQETAVAHQRGDGTTHITRSQDYAGRVATGVPGGEVTVSDFSAQPPSSTVRYPGVPDAEELMKLDRVGQDGKFLPTSAETQIVLPSEFSLDGQDLLTSTSSVRATVQQVSRRIVRQKRRVIRKIVIIDGKEHVTEEVVDEPEEVEETGEGIPRVSIEINRRGDTNPTVVQGISQLQASKDNVETSTHYTSDEKISGLSDEASSKPLTTMGSNGKPALETRNDVQKVKSPSVFSRIAKRTRKALKKVIGSEGQEYVVTPDDEIQDGSAEFYVSTEELSPSPGVSPTVRRTKKVQRKVKGPDGKEYEEEVEVTEDGTASVRTLKRVIRKIKIVDGEEQVVEEVTEYPEEAPKRLDNTGYPDEFTEKDPDNRVRPSETLNQQISEPVTPEKSTPSSNRENSPSKEPKAKDRWSIKESIFGTPKLKRQRSKEKTPERKIGTKETKTDVLSPERISDSGQEPETKTASLKRNVSRKEKTPDLSDSERGLSVLPEGSKIPVEETFIAVKAPSRSPSPEKEDKTDVNTIVTDFIKNERVKHEGYPERTLPLLPLDRPRAPPRKTVPDNARSRTPTPAPRSSVSPQRNQSTEPVKEELMTETISKRPPFGGIRVGVRVPEDAVHKLKKVSRPDRSNLDRDEDMPTVPERSRHSVKTVSMGPHGLVKSEEVVEGHEKRISPPADLKVQLGSEPLSSWQVTTTKTVIPTVVTREVKMTRRVVKKVIFVDGKEHVTEEVIDEPQESVVESVITGEPTTTVTQEKKTSNVGGSHAQNIDETDDVIQDYYVSRDAMGRRPDEKVDNITVVKKFIGKDGAEQTVVIQINESEEIFEKTQILAVKTVTKIVYVLIYSDGREHVTESDFEVLPPSDLLPKRYRLLRKTVRTVRTQNGNKVIEEKEEVVPPTTWDDITSAINDIAKNAPRLKESDDKVKSPSMQTPSPPDRKKKQTRTKPEVQGTPELKLTAANAASKYENIIKVKVIRKIQGVDGKESVSVEKRVEQLPASLIDPLKPRIIRRTIYITVKPDGSEEVTQEDKEEMSLAKPSMFTKLVRDTKDMMRKVVSTASPINPTSEVISPPSPMAEFYEPSEEITVYPGERITKLKIIRSQISPDGVEQTTEEDMEEDEVTPKSSKKSQPSRQVTKIVYQLTHPDGSEIFMETDAEEIKPGRLKIIRRVIRTFKTTNGVRELVNKSVEDVDSQKLVTVENIIDDMMQNKLISLHSDSQTTPSKDLSPTEENIIITKTVKRKIRADGTEETSVDVKKENIPVADIDPAHPIVIRKTIYVVVDPEGKEHVTQEYVQEEADIDLEFPVSQLIKKTKAHFPDLYISEDDMRRRKKEWIKCIKVIRTVEKEDGKEQTTEGEVSEPDSTMPKETKLIVTKIIHGYVPLQGNEKVVEIDVAEVRPTEFEEIRRTFRTIEHVDGKQNVCEERVQESDLVKSTALDDIIQILRTTFTKSDTTGSISPVSTIEFCFGLR